MDNMEKELWDAFYGKESKQERCSVLTEAELNKHNKGMLKEGFMSDEDIHNQFSKFEVLDFSKEGEHSGYIELSFPNADEVDYDSSVITGYTIYEDGKVAFDNWFPDDVYNEVAEYVKQHHSEELDEGCGKKKKKALKENVDAAPYSTAITNALYTGDLDKEEIASEFINYFSEDELEDVCNILNIEVDDKYINSPSKYGDTLSDMIFNMTINVNALVNEFIQYASDDQCKDILNSLDLLDEFDFLNEGCSKKKKKALKESAESVYIYVDKPNRHNNNIIVKSDEFGKITYLPNDFEKLEDTIKRAVNDYAAENNIAEYEVIKLYESKKALKEDYEKDYEEDEELTPVDADSLDVDEFYNGYVMDNAALWDEDIDYDAMEANKNQIFQFWKQLVKGGEDEWDAVEISVRRFASNEELDEGCGKNKLNEDVEIQPDLFDDEYDVTYEDGRRLYDSSEIKNFMKKFPTYELNGHKLDFLLPINMSDLRPFNSNKDETMLLYFPKSKDNVSEKELSEINSELYNTFGTDVYAVIGFDRKYPGIKFIEIRYLDKNNLTTKKKAVKESADNFSQVMNEGCGKKKKKALKESDDLWSQIQNYKKKYGNPYEESRPTSNGVDDEIKKILNKYNQEYNFLYNNHDKVAGYEEAVRAWDEYINHPDFRELIGKVIKARHDMFTSDREIGALMFALDALGYLDKFDGKESSLEPVVKEFKMNEGKSAKFYKIKCPQFNHLTKINKLAGEGDELASYYMKHRNDEFYSSKEAKEELKRYKNTSFKTYLTVEEA